MSKRNIFIQQLKANITKMIQDDDGFVTKMIQDDGGQDKMARPHTPNMVTWESFGQEQRIIRKHYRRDYSYCTVLYMQDDEPIRICDV